jgi:DNA polymerase III subunit gamma/tau
MYLVDKYRPTTFDEVVGQDHVIKILKKIIQNPENFPKNFIFCGEYGTGKTTISRVFGKILTNDLYVKEYDMRVLGNVESMKDLKNFIDNVLKFKKEKAVLIFNEIQTASSGAQDFFLDTLEDNKDKNTYFIFTTTNVEKMLDTVRSRCAYEFAFKLIQPELIKEHILKICKLENIEINDEAINLIIKKSKRHMRDAINLIDLYKIDPDMFKETIMDTTELLDNYIFKGKEIINEITSYPVNNLKEDLSVLISDYIQSDGNLMFKIMLFENYMKYKNYVDCIEDFIAVINILKKIYRTKK